MHLLIRSFFVFILLLVSSVFWIQKSEAATVASISATVTTSRPSASSPLSADQAANATQVQIFDNGSIFLASDSATLRADATETQNIVNVASMSGSNTPSSGKRIVYFTQAAANTHHLGDAMTTAITAMHTVQFTLSSALPANGRVVIQYPGSANNTASPSATTFAFNGLAIGNVKTNGITCNGSSVISSPNITCYSTAGIAAGTQLTFLIGCSAATGVNCTAQVPTLINPSKSATSGTADTWNVAVTTQDSDANLNVTIDTGKGKIGTIESVQVQASVDPTLTFTIAGIAAGTTINVNNSACTSDTDVTTAGLTTPTASFVDLGVINQNGINIAAQDLTVSTNGQNGYAITSTSSGQLMNPATGYAISSSTTPVVLTAGTEKFGIHPCGSDVNTTTWVAGATGGGAGAKYGWPTATFVLPIAYRASVANAIKTTVEYAGTVNGQTPAGTYNSVITYVATPSF